MNQNTKKALTGIAGIVTVQANGILVPKSGTTATDVCKAMAAAGLTFGEASPKGNNWYIPVFDKKTVTEFVAKESTGTGGGAPAEHLSDKQVAQFMRKVLAKVEANAPKEDKQRVYAYADIEAIAKEFKYKNAEGEDTTWYDTLKAEGKEYCESFNEGNTGHRMHGNVREFIGQALQYANGNGRRAARQGTIVVHPDKEAAGK
jgi:hypothetical protein